MQAFSDTWTAVAARYQKLVEVRTAVATEASRRRVIAAQKQEEEGRLRHRLDVLGQSTEFVQGLIDDLSQQGVAEMEAMLTSAVNAAFVDRGYRVKIVVDDRGKDKTAEFVLLTQDEEGWDRESELASNGDGLSAILAFVTRVFFIVRFGRARVMFDDESLKELSPRFAVGMAKFIRTVIDELGFVMVLITHARTQFLPYADRVYYVEKGGRVFETTAAEVLALGSGEDKE